MAAHSTPSKPLVPVLFGSLIAILLFWVATQLLASWIPAGSNEEAEKAELRAKNLADLQLADKEVLETYGWVNKEKGIVRVPIKTAMEGIVPVLNSRPPAPAYPIATPAPAADAAPAGATAEPAPPAETPIAAPVETAQ